MAACVWCCQLDSFYAVKKEDVDAFSIIVKVVITNVLVIYVWALYSKLILRMLLL
jgi:hypothetical protein